MDVKDLPGLTSKKPEDKEMMQITLILHVDIYFSCIMQNKDYIWCLIS
jgi:hypothetical protein